MINPEVQNFPFWRHLDTAWQERLDASVRRADYAAGQEVRGNGSECLGVLMLLSGRMRVYISAEDGREATIYRLGQGEICVLSASCTMPDIHYDVQIQAMEDSSALILPTPVFARLIRENIYVENYAYRSATEHFSDIIQAIEQLLFQTLEQRLVSFLLDEAASQNSDELHVTQEQTARAIGSAREAVTRSLKKLSQEGLIRLFRGGVELLDRKELYSRV